jgi:hypothetical protein
MSRLKRIIKSPAASEKLIDNFEIAIFNFFELMTIINKRSTTLHQHLLIQAAQIKVSESQPIALRCERDDLANVKVAEQQPLTERSEHLEVFVSDFHQLRQHFFRHRRS